MPNLPQFDDASNNFVCDCCTKSAGTGNDMMDHIELYLESNTKHVP